MVSAAQPLATQAGAAMLEAGGNAADAAVAAGFAISVVEPTMNSIGGRNQILIRLPTGEFRGIDGTTQAPATYDPDTAPQAGYGYPTVGVPGALAGLFRLHEEYGSLPLETVMGPALELAASGFEILPGEARRQQMAAEQIAEFDGSAAHFLGEDGQPLQAGEHFVQPDLAATLRTILEGGRQVFYEGELARRMVDDVSAHGGALTMESLRDYRAEDAVVVTGSYRGFDLAGTFTPAAGATSIEIFQILENFDLAAMDPVQWASVVGQAFTLAYGDYRQITGPDAHETLTSKAFARERAALIEVPMVVPAQAAMASPMEAADAQLAMAVPADAPIEADAWIMDQHHTTHLSTADADGMMVALTQTIGPNMGSKVATPGMGFLYAATLGGYLGRVEPGERARSFISPLIISRDGEPVLVIGAAGGARIPVAVIHTALRIMDQGLPLDQALAAPRVAPTVDGLQLETSPGIGWAPEVVEALRGLGMEIDTQERDGAFGRAHAVYWDAPAGQWVGGADPDWEGSARGPGS
jgi:gamma-glutamyltranspeptidase/glutathione hydrolase